MTDSINVTTVMEQIQEAARTIRLLPPVKAREKFCNWPDIVQNFMDAYGYTAPTFRIVPTAKQITRLDQVIDWLTWVPPETARIIWARSEGYPWRKIAGKVGKDPKTCKERFRIGVVAISLKESKK